MRLNFRLSLGFGLLVGLAAILMDAGVAHGLWWENDPYWAYWVTKTFLITAVFTIGTVLFGIGIRQGLLINLIHTLILEVYYEWLSPIGLPQEPLWLATRDLWWPGFAVHYLTILTGYFIALWLWHRSAQAKTDENPPTSLGYAIGSVLIVLISDALITQWLLLDNFPGITFYVQRLLITVVFIAWWQAFVGYYRGGLIGAAAILALIWTSYSMYLAPVGLPHSSPRYLGYTDLWQKTLPGSFASIWLGLLISTSIWPKLVKNGAKLAVVIGLITVLLAPSITRAADGLQASAASEGKAMMIVGPDPNDLSRIQEATGKIDVKVTDIGNRWSHIQNIDLIDVKASWRSGDSTYEVMIEKAMPHHPLGRYTTWFGVVYDAAMHGDTGIGTDRLPRVTPEIALWGYARVTKDGQVIAAAAPAHVMVTRDESVLHGIMLEVATEDQSLVGLPDGYLNVMWPEIGTLVLPTQQKHSRETAGWLALVTLTLGFGFSAKREQLINGGKIRG